MSPMPRSRLSRLATALIARILLPGLSSMKMGALESDSSASRMRLKSSSSFTAPVRSFHELTNDSAASMRSISCSELISSEKMPTGTPWRTAALRAISKASDVLPIDGRAAMMTRSEGWKPESRSSMAGNPEGTPRRPVWVLCNSSRRSKLSARASLTEMKPRRSSCWDKAKIFCSTSSKISPVGRDWLKANSLAAAAVSINWRLSQLSLTRRP